MPTKKEVEAENTKLKEENDALQKFIAGNMDFAAEVKTLIARDWTKEFIRARLSPTTRNDGKRWGWFGTTIEKWFKGMARSSSVAN